MFNLVNTVYAQTATNVLRKNPFISDLLQKISNHIISPIIAIAFSLAFLVFVYGVFGMISSQGDTEKRENGKKSIMWGVIGMVIMLSVFGIMNLIVNTIPGAENPFR